MNPTIRKNAFLASSTSISAARRRGPRAGAVPGLGLVMLLLSTSFPVAGLIRWFELAGWMAIPCLSRLIHAIRYPARPAAR